MITIGEMQISGVLTMLMLSVMLMLCAPGRSIRRRSFARARWMMATGTGLIAVQFALQYIFGFRQMGVTQAVLFNFLFFTPASLLCGMAILYMQRNGSVVRKEWLTVCGICGAAILMLAGTALLDGVPLRQGSPALRMAEYVGAVLYVVMQTYIFIMQLKAYKQLKLAVDEYYDRERRDLFGWMGWSMRTMALLAFFVPVVIFLEGTPLVGFSIAYFFAIAYSTISLYSYGISKDVEHVEESLMEEVKEVKGVKEVKEVLPSGQAQAEKPNVLEIETDGLTTEISQAVDSWIASGHYREHNLTLGIVARQMGVPQRQLQEWLRQSGYGKLAELVATLRIEEAKRMLVEHPEWSVESIADHCGFNERKYFHYVFQQHTGTTPSKYQEANER